MEANLTDKRLTNAEWAVGDELMPDNAAYRQKADEAVVESVPFSKILELVDGMKPSADVIEVQQLNVLKLLAVLAQHEIQKSTFPFVFADNIELGKALELRPRQVARSLERLEALGFITILGERHAPRARAENIMGSTCLDLRILIARYEELKR